MTKQQMFRERRELCALLPKIEERLFRVGLIKTAHALNVATKKIGYETVEQESAAAREASK